MPALIFPNLVNIGIEDNGALYLTINFQLTNSVGHNRAVIGMAE
jgi:hypothetical protein